MNYYSDPTANLALGNINREFSKHIKKAKRLCKLYKEGKLSAEALDAAHKQFNGLYRHVLDNVIKEDSAKDQ